MTITEKILEKLDILINDVKADIEQSSSLKLYNKDSYYDYYSGARDFLEIFHNKIVDLQDEEQR